MTSQQSTKTGYPYVSFRAVALFGLMALIATMTAAASAAEDEETWQMATRNADIQEFVAQVAKITGKNLRGRP